MKRINLVKGAVIMASLLMVSMSLAGCNKGNAEATPTPGVIPSLETIPVDTPTPEPTLEPEEVEEVVEGCYRSELTNEWIDEALQNQRPIAAMVDNEKTALNHFGVNKCDIIYEIMNSTANDRITRLMCIVKDYESIEQLGSIRSTRPTNFMLAGEYDAILVHDGGPFYNDVYYGKDYVNNLSGGFARIPNGKSSEFTEYVTPNEFTNSRGRTYDGLLKRIEDANYSREYTQFYNGNHFNFSNKDYMLSDPEFNKGADDVKEVKEVDLGGAFHHNGSKLIFNEDTQTYDYYEYGNAHVDELDNGNVTSFKNLIIYSVDFNQLDENGYLIYNVIGSGTDGWFITNGEATPLTWAKETENGLTLYKNSITGEDILLNTGKTYIALIPSDSWSKITVGEPEATDEAPETSTGDALEPDEDGAIG